MTHYHASLFVNTEGTIEAVMSPHVDLLVKSAEEVFCVVVNAMAGLAVGLEAVVLSDEQAVHGSLACRMPLLAA